MREQAAFAAESQAMYEGGKENATATATQEGEPEDDEDFWTDLEAFEAEMDQMALSGGQEGDASKAGPPSTLQPLRGLNPSAATFSFQPASQQTVTGQQEQNFGYSPASGGDDEYFSTAMGADTAASSTSGGPGLCPLYRTSGHCARGNACHYVHGDLCEASGLPMFELLASLCNETNAK